MNFGRVVRSSAVVGCLSLALTALMSTRGDAASPRAVRRELEHAQALLRKALAPRPGIAADPRIVLVRDDQHLSLRFPASLVFESDAQSLTPNAMTSAPLAATLRLLKRRHAWSAQLWIYTDAIGGAGPNQSFSVARAEALDTALIAAGVAADQLQVHGAGASNPVAGNDSPEGRSQNRRVEVVFERRPPAASPPTT